MRALQRSWDSVSEPVDESRNVECQGTVVDVDSDDEFFVRDTQMDSDDSNAPLVRSGRFAAPSTSEDEHQFADAVRAPPGVSDTEESQFRQSTPGVSRQDPSGEGVPDTTTVALPESIEEALQFDLTQHDSDVDKSNMADQSMRVPGQCGGESDTDSVGALVEHVPEDNRVSRTRRRRRLTLVSSQGVPDSHDQRFMRVRQQMQQETQCARNRRVEVARESIVSLAMRVGTVTSDDIPREIRRQR